MTAELSRWVSGILCGAVLCAAAQLIMPQGVVKKVTGFVCGIVMCSLVILPVVWLDRGVISSSLREYRNTVEAVMGENNECEKNLLRTYIEEKLSAYILDEARTLGAEPESVEVTVVWNNEEWIPERAVIIVKKPFENQAHLQHIIETELGIPASGILWREPDG